MSHELQYTSAEQTLQPGLKGFGPVVVSRGLPATLQEKLVVLSAYRHLFSGQDPKAKLNPVNYSHLIIPASGKTFHVLSRVADAGLDYSHRTNKFAHHVAVDVSERPPSGPAAILGAVGFMSAKFSGTPQWLDQGRRLPQLEVKPAVCRAWQAVTSDAGWGGVLAETALAENAQPVIVVYRLGLDVLPLVAEAIALLPLEKRWQVTFSTFYQKLPPGVACQWRFMPVEDAETKAAVKALNVKVIDLTRKLDKPVPSPWVEAARTGHRPVPTTARGAKDAALGLAPDKVGGARAGGPAANLSSVQLDSLANDDLFNFDNLPVATPLLVVTPVRRTNRAWMVGLAAGVLIVIVAAFFAMQMLRDTPETIAAAPAVPAPPRAIPPQAPVEPVVVPPSIKPPAKMTAAVDVTPPSPALPDSPQPPTKSVSVERPPRETTDTTPPPVEQTPVDPFVVLRQVRAQSLGLPLTPAPLDGSVNTDTSEPQWIELVELPRVDRAKFDLHLTVPSGTTAKFILEPPAAAGPERTCERAAADRQSRRRRRTRPTASQRRSAAIRLVARHARYATATTWSLLADVDSRRTARDGAVSIPHATCRSVRGVEWHEPRTAEESPLEFPTSAACDPGGLQFAAGTVESAAGDDRLR